MRRKEIKEVLGMKFTKEVLEEKIAEISILIDKLTPAMMKVYLKLNLDEKMNELVTKQIAENDLTYYVSEDGDRIVIDNDSLETPLSFWHKEHNALEVIVPTFDPKMVLDKVTNDMKSEIYAKNLLIEHIINPILKDYGPDSKEADDIRKQLEKTTLGFVLHEWINVSNDPKMSKSIKNPWVTDQKRANKVQEVQSDTSKLFMLAYCGEDKLYIDNQSYNLLKYTYKFANSLLLTMSNKSDISPAKLLTVKYDLFRQKLISMFLSLFRGLKHEDDIMADVDWMNNTVHDFVLRSNMYINLVSNILFMENRITPKYKQLGQVSGEELAEAFNNSFKLISKSNLNHFTNDMRKKLILYTRDNIMYTESQNISDEDVDKLIDNLKDGIENMLKGLKNEKEDITWN